MKEHLPTPELTPENLSELKKRAMDHYRKREFKEAFKIAAEMGETKEALEVQVYLYAYSPEHRDQKQVDPNNPDSAVSKLLSLDSKNLVALNSMIVYSIEIPRQGGEPLPSLTSDYLESIVKECLASAGEDSPLQRANIIQNAARLSRQSRKNNSQARQEELSWLEETVSLYDKSNEHRHKDILSEKDPLKQASMVLRSPNLHHIAGAYFRCSETSKQAGDINKALEFAKNSEQLWTVICNNSPNPAFQKNLTDTGQWIEDLEKRRK